MKSKSKTSSWVAIPALALLAVAIAGVRSADAQATTSTTETSSNSNSEAKMHKGMRGDHAHVFMHANHPQLTDEQKAEMKQKHEAIDSALTSGNYTAYISAVAGTPREGKVTEAQFLKMVEAHKLMKAGDHKGAQAIMKELGLNGPGHFMHPIMHPNK